MLWLVSSYLEHLFFSTHNEIHDVDGVLHVHTDRDTITDTELAATPSSIDWSVWGARTLSNGPGTLWIMLGIFDE